MILKNTDLWSSTADLILVTTNSTINSRGELVMGRGAAKEAKRRFPTLPKLAALHIQAYGKLVEPGRVWYGVVFSLIGNVGLFQVKYHYADNARLDLIEASVNMLLETGLFGHTRWFGSGRVSEGFRVAMNFPGIGAGMLDRKLVLPIIERLPDSVEIHEIV